MKKLQIVATQLLYKKEYNLFHNSYPIATIHEREKYSEIVDTSDYMEGFLFTSKYATLQEAIDEVEKSFNLFYEKFTK